MQIYLALALLFLFFFHKWWSWSSTLFLLYHYNIWVLHYNILHQKQCHAIFCLQIKENILAENYLTTDSKRAGRTVCLRDEPVKNKDYWWMPYWPESLCEAFIVARKMFSKRQICPQGSQLAGRLFHIC